MLFRIALVLLIALPILSAMAMLFALQVLEYATRSPEEGAISSRALSATSRGLTSGLAISVGRTPTRVTNDWRRSASVQYRGTVNLGGGAPSRRH